MAIKLDWTSELSDMDDELQIEQWIDKLEQLLQLACQTAHIDSGTVSLSFVDDETIRKLNKQYRQVDHATDVLSFAMTENEDEMFSQPNGVNAAANMERLLGDVVIAVPTALEQSKAYGHSLEREIGFLFVHGLLHLIGYDHHDEAAEEEMFSLQEEILHRAGLER